MNRPFLLGQTGVYVITYMLVSTPFLGSDLFLLASKLLNC